MESKLKRIYYSNDGYDGYWRRKSAIQNYLKHQVQQKKRRENGYKDSHCTKYVYHRQNIFLDLMQVCHYMLNQMIFIRQIFFIYLMTDTKRKIYKYALSIVNVASRYKGSYQLTTKNSKEIAQTFHFIYTNTLLTYP